MKRMKNLTKESSYVYAVNTRWNSKHKKEHTSRVRPSWSHHLKVMALIVLRKTLVLSLSSLDLAVQLTKFSQDSGQL